MKVLHTADWHIGARTNDLNRLPEQVDICKQIVDIANQQKVDMVVVAGDIYDNFMPSAEAEKLVFNTLLKLSDNGHRPVIVIAGNHDDHKRLTNASVFAQSHNIYLVGELKKIDFKRLANKDAIAVKSGIGSIEFKLKNGENVVVAALPYPSYFRYKQIKKDGEQLNDIIADWFKPALAAFRDDTINITVSHLLTYASGASPQEFEELEVLGGLTSFVDNKKLLSKAHYTALGHVHNAIAVNKEAGIYFSGATINKHFNHGTRKNFVLVADIDVDGLKDVKKVEIKNIKLESQKVGSLAEAYAYLKTVSNCHVKLIFTNENFISPAEIKELKSKYPCVITITVEPRINKERVVISKRDLTTKEIFEKFVEQKTGEKPKKDVTDLFLEIMGEVVYEAE